MKYFKMTNGADYDLYVCGDDIPIPTAEEIVEERDMNKACKEYPVVEITKEEFLKLHNEFLDDILKANASEVMWYAPNLNELHTWEFWF